MPDRETLKRAHEDALEGKSPSTQAGEFVREEIHHVREGEHGARSAKQAIAIGLSKARRAGVDLPPPKKGSASGAVRRRAERDLKKAGSHQKGSRTRSRATEAALQRASHDTTSPQRLAEQARESSRRRGPTARHESAQKAVRTKERSGPHRAASKTAKRRRSHR